MQRPASSSRPFRVGARGSALSVAQCEAALAFLRRTFPGTDYARVVVQTPGDRDLATPLETSAPDFFTRDLDDAVRNGAVDFAVHSAKDLPGCSGASDGEMAGAGLDWFWLPLREDPRDCWVRRADAKRIRKIGVSSARRRVFAAAAHPKAALLPMRGAVDDRLEQVRRGDFDAALMAVAGLKRLGFFPVPPPGLVVEPIPVSALPPPEAQGVLAVTFRAGDERLLALRAHFVKEVRFVSAGVGDAGLCTLVGARDLAAADVVLYDDLLGGDLLAGVSASCIHVGKRCGAHSLKQNEITRRICDEARKGRRVVRLKGGDAGLFGRLAEETDALAALQIPFVVRPGVSALVAATTGTGLLLTRRGEARGFDVFTPRSTGAETNLVAFMAAQTIREESRRLLAEGRAKTTPCAVVYDAAGLREHVVAGTLGAFVRRRLPAETAPGLFVVGPAAAHAWPALGVLGGRRVLVTCSEAVRDKALCAVEDRGGRPVYWPLVKLSATRRFDDLSGFDAIVLTSPSAVRLFFASTSVDRRRLPAFWTCGAGTDAELRRFGVASDVLPAADFSAAGLIAEIRRRDLSGLRFLRLRSAKAGGAVASALRKSGARVVDAVLYRNDPVVHAAPLPPFDDALFCSASAVEAFCAAHGEAALAGKGVLVLGAPTRAALPAAVLKTARAVETFPLWEMKEPL